MLRSMYSGVSGLKNHQVRMDVIGNNIANVNTTGFKKSRVVFKDTLYQNMRGATSPSDLRGGTNPMGVGLGVAVASIDQLHSQAPTTTTNNMTDMAINGNGYFIFKNGEEAYYSRAGSCGFDIDNNLVSNANGYKVQGWMATTDPARQTASGDFLIETKGSTTGINIADYESISARATGNMIFSGNLDAEFDIPQIGAVPADIDPAQTAALGQFPSDTDDVKITSMDVFDSLGRKQTVYFRFFKYAAEGPATLNSTRWACDISLNPLFNNVPGFDGATDFLVAPVDLTAPVAPALTAALTLGGAGTTANQIVRAYNLQFNADGAVPGQVANPQNPLLAQLQLTIDKGTNPVPLQPTQEALARDIVCKVDFNKLTQFKATADARVESQDGYSKGSMTSFSIGSDGVIKGFYDNGQFKSLARVAIATFDNPSGLIQSGGTIFQESNNSGTANIGVAGESGKGTIAPNSLEMSNVDLSEEFTDMIVTQRGFQANSRIITTSDEMLQELVNLKR